MLPGIDHSFFVPLVCDQPKSIYESLGNFIEKFLYFGGKKVYIYPTKSEIKVENELVWKIALKVSVWLC